METVQDKDSDKISIQMDMASVHGLPGRSNLPASKRKKPSPPNAAVVNLLGHAGSFLVIAVLSIACYYAISTYLLQSVEVVGSSMIPTLHERNHYLLNRWALRNREPQHNDVVVIRDPGDHGFSVKRVVAVEGESIYFKNGKVYVNSKQLEEPYLLPGTYTFTYARAHSEFITCGKGQYFVLGDNRPVSIDSRSYGPVSRGDILGVVMVN